MRSPIAIRLIEICWTLAHGDGCRSVAHAGEGMAHPRGFEPLTPAFGGNMASSANKRKEPPMSAYLPVNAAQFAFLLRQSYSSPRHCFRPRAYVVLTREETLGSEEAHA